MRNCRKHFPLIRACFRQFVKPGACGTSYQTREQGASGKPSMQLGHNSALHHPRQPLPTEAQEAEPQQSAAEGATAAVPTLASATLTTGVGLRGHEGCTVHADPGFEASRPPGGPSDSAAAGPLGLGGRASCPPPPSPPWRSHCSLHTSLGRRERWDHLPNMQRRREDGFLSGKHRQEGSLGFLF